ncbi:hypothetical protein [Paraburkholderia youngii]|uniref:hypothetical protein n=1 Tax=Paraburkholderia youngii TaxID=2782701 RepID=UPI0020CD9C2A|nr:hypothetical protein [Paraburkholderia youngii]
MRHPTVSSIHLEGELKLTLNTEKTHITHVNDGFVFLGHRIIRKRGPRGRMRPVTTIPWEKYRGFAERLVKQLSGNYGDEPKIAAHVGLSSEWSCVGKTRRKWSAL